MNQKMSAQENDGRRFPILDGGTIPWNIAEKAYLEYSRLYGREQSLERLAERGGFGEEEMDEFCPSWRKWRRERRRKDAV